MKSTILRANAFRYYFDIVGKKLHATTSYIATHTFKVAEGKGSFDEKYVAEKFSPPHAKDIKVAGVNVVTAKVVCQYNLESGKLITTYRATISGKLLLRSKTLWWLAHTLTSST